MHTMQIASLPIERTDNAHNYSGKKELTSVYSVVVKLDANEQPSYSCDDSGMRELIDCRCWMGRSSRSSVVHASIWVHGRGGHSYAGAGRAGGYGYHKPSAAIGDAIRSAGIKLTKDIHGVGETAIRDALKAIAVALGYPSCLIVEH